MIAICADHNSSGFGNFEGNVINEFGIPISFIAVGDTAFNKPQFQSISQVDMYPTILDYLGYNKPFVSLGNSAFSSEHATIQYLGNGIYTIFQFPYALEFDNSTQKVNRLMKYHENRTLVNIPMDNTNSSLVDSLTRKVKSYVQVFSCRVNKNQF